MRSYWISVDLNPGCLVYFEEGRRHTDTQVRGHVKTEAEMGIGEVSTSQGAPCIVSNATN